jgi:predicted ferric reductase
MLRRVLFWAVSVVFPLPLVATYNLLAREPAALRLYIVLGLIAYSWWLLAVLLSVRPSWLDRFVGLPSIYGLHGMLGVMAVVLAYIHRANSYSGNRLAIVLGDWAFYGALLMLCFAVFFMSGWLVDRFTVLLKAKRVLEVVFRHQLSVWIHRVNLVIIVMIWVHAHLLVRVNQHFAFMMLLDLYTVAVLTIYAWKKWIAPDTYLTGTVVRNDAYGPSARRVSVHLDRPANVQPGDFFFIRFEDASGLSREWHPFSVTDDDQQTISFTVSQRGDFTRRMTDLKVGARARLEGPFGRFQSIVQGYKEDSPLVLLGMGAGVAPLMSLAAAHHPHRNIHLLWAVRREQDAYYRNELARYQAASGNRMQVAVKVGRFHREDFAAALPPAALTHGAFFVVGPNPAVHATQRLLRRLGVSPRHIHQERLTM